MLAGIHLATKDEVKREVAALRQEMHQEFQQSIKKKKFASRTASTRYEERNPVTATHWSHFGIQTLAKVPFYWPVLADTLLEEDRKHPANDCVQLRASREFPKFMRAIEKSKRSLTATYIDTHASPMSNGAKPDNTHTVCGTPASPANVRFLGDIKRRRKNATFSNEEKEHVVGFALQ